MAEISAALVKELRELTGLGMMECKKALAEAGGDLKKAEELLRIKSGAKASKAATRVAAEGVIGSFISSDQKLGALVEVNCETDFVARNDDFLAFAKSIAEVVATRDPGAAEEDKRQKLVQKIGENITIRRFKRVQAKGRLAVYIHAGGKIGVLVDYEGAEEVGKDVAMHIAFARPRHLSKAEVPQEIISSERKIQEARAKESGKPAEIAAKMVEGSLNKFLAEISLLGQPFIKDDKQTIEKMLAAKKAQLHGYAFLVVGEGIEKAQPTH
ncbi:MAG: elongation factor Ts [Betaproteobacteria bacterium]|jgi:elongation factor Ts|nr:elongation factor Ts [Betaproteobacteria bacterium]